MKHVLIAIVMLTAATASFAAGPIGFGVQATAANVNFEGPAKEIYGFGFGGGAHLDINVLPVVSLRVQGDYISFAPDKGKYSSYLASQAGVPASDIAVDGGRVNFISANANVMVDILPLPVLSPYVTGGAGITSFSYSDLTVRYQGIPIPVPKPESQTKFSANLGIGTELDLAVVKVYLEARYTWIFTEGSTSTYIPVSLGVTF